MSAPREVRARSFGAVAADYDRLRPPLPMAVADAASIGPGTRVLDLAAGTGLATRTFVLAGATVVAVEPDPAMLAVLAAQSPTVDARVGTAEEIPLDDASVDVVTVCSAWHWFDPAVAGAEIARVLRDGGRLAICWNGLDQRVDWVAAFARLRDSTSRSDGLGDRFGHSPEAVALEHLPFCPPTTATIPWTWRRSIGDLSAMLATYSGIITVDEDARRDVLVRGAALLEPFAGADGTVEVPMAARFWLAERAPRTLS